MEDEKKGRAAKRATMRDVAAASGVSPSTVSFVLNDAPHQTISAATRARVLRAADELGYVPHGVARALREGSSRIVLLNLDPLFRGGSIDGYTRGLDDELGRHGHVLLVRRAGGSPMEPVVDAVVPRAVVNLAGIYDEWESEADGGWVDGLGAHTRSQLTHLHEAGHVAVAFALPGDVEAAPFAHVRVRLARAAAASVGIAALEVLPVPRDVESARAAVGEFLATHPEVTAVAAFDDVVALRVLAALRALGKRVPGDLAVIGFDATEHGAYWDPPLTSVRVDAEAFGRRAARQALGLDASDVVPGPATVVAGGTA